MEDMEVWNKFINCSVKVIYNDGGIYPRKKEGILTAITKTHLILKTENHTEGLLISNIQRIEVQEK